MPKICMKTRKALSVGINEFRDFEQFRLRGCVADVENFTKVLVENMEFSEKNIVKLVNEQATKANIIGALRPLVKDAKQGNCSYIVMHMATHGTQTRDTSADEVDHMDEAFIPYDIKQTANEWDSKHIINDDELSEILSEVPAGVLFEGFFDTCHSGTGIREIDLKPDRKPRYVAPPMMNNTQRSVEFLQVHTLREALAQDDMRNHVLFTGCRDDQTSADTNIDGHWNGAFTYYLCSELRKSQNKLSRAELIEHVRSALSAKYPQVPQLNAMPDYQKLPIGSWPEQTLESRPVENITPQEGTPVVSDEVQNVVDVNPAIPQAAISNLPPEMQNIINLLPAAVQALSSFLNPTGARSIATPGSITVLSEEEQEFIRSLPAFYKAYKQVQLIKAS